MTTQTPCTQCSKGGAFPIPVYHTVGPCPFAVTAAPITPLPSAVPAQTGPLMHVPRLLQVAFSLEMARKRRGNIIVTGPSGTGKSVIAEHLSEGQTFTYIDCAAYTTKEDFGGERELSEVNGHVVTTFTRSRVVDALERPGVLFFDEFNRATDELRNILLPLMDETRAFKNPASQVYHIRHDENLFIMAMNKGFEYSGTHAIDPAFISRSRTVSIGYPEPRVEAQIVQTRWPIDPDTMGDLIRFANTVRERKAADHPEWPAIGTRELVQIAEAITLGVNPEDAVELTVLQNLDTVGGVNSTYVQVRQALVFTGGNA